MIKPSNFFSRIMLIVKGEELEAPKLSKRIKDTLYEPRNKSDKPKSVKVLLAASKLMNFEFSFSMVKKLSSPFGSVNSGSSIT